MKTIIKNRKITAVFLAILMVFSVISSTVGITAMSSSAATFNIAIENDTSLYHSAGTLNNGYSLESTDYFPIISCGYERDAVYCLEPGVSVTGFANSQCVSEC